MSTTFADLGVSPAVARALSKRGINSPFPVQKLVIEDCMAGEDVLVQSPTGSGKTLAFGVPLVERVAADARRPAALVLAPTRELARQIVDEIDEIAKAKALKISVVYGGVGIQPQIRAAGKAHILVATPGRLEDLLERRALTLGHIRTLVLDEADRMLDMGFKPAVDRIVRLIPKDRQTLFFSATLEGAAGKLAATYTKNPRTHVHSPKREKSEMIDHKFIQTESQGSKIDVLIDELRKPACERALVFVRTKRGADRLVKKLGTRNVKALAMHGDKTQSQRQKALARFDRGDISILVATDVAARGIDVPEITHVVQFDMAEDADTYTHRIGRTGRAGRGGLGIALFLSDQGQEMSGMARDLGVAKEFDARVGSELGFKAPQPKGNNNGRGGGRPGGNRGGGGNRDGGRTHSNRTVASAGGNRHRSKQGGGGSTGPRKNRSKQRAR